jgi:hypothetical protein
LGTQELYHHNFKVPKDFAQKASNPKLAYPTDYLPISQKCKQNAWVLRTLASFEVVKQGSII